MLIVNWKLHSEDGMTSLTKEEEAIISTDFRGSTSDEIIEIKRLIIEVKKHKGLYQEVLVHGANLYNSQKCIAEKIGLSARVSGDLARTLWFLVRPELEVIRQLKLGIDEATWVYDSTMCKHKSHEDFNGKKYSIHKGMRTGFFKRTYPGRLVGCGCMARPIIPGLDNKTT